MIRLVKLPVLNLIIFLIFISVNMYYITGGEVDSTINANYQSSDQYYHKTLFVSKMIATILATINTFTILIIGILLASTIIYLISNIINVNYNFKKLFCSGVFMLYIPMIILSFLVLNNNIQNLGNLNQIKVILLIIGQVAFNFLWMFFYLRIEKTKFKIIKIIPFFGSAAFNLIMLLCV